MASATREIRRRIRSVGSTKKVTKAMELVASAKMRRTVSQVLATRVYANRAWDLLTNLSFRTDPASHALLRRGASGRIGLVLISSNRGLVGGFNTQLVVQSVVALQRFADQGQPEVVLYGKKGRTIVTKYGYTAAAEFEKHDVVSDILEIRPLAKLVIGDFVSGRFDRIVLAYTDYHSTIVQRPRIRQLLPIELDTELGQVHDHPHEEIPARSKEHVREYIYEPNPDHVLEAVLRRLVEIQLYQAVLESNASEHAARMVAMRNATDAAQDLLDDLTLSYNQARQAAITQDLAEISASRTALES